MARSKFLACRSLRDHAEPRSSVLRAEYIPSATTEELDRVLAKSRDKSMAAAQRNSHLAA
jgi:hypothetical protein